MGADGVCFVWVPQMKHSTLPDWLDPCLSGQSYHSCGNAACCTGISLVDDGQHRVSHCPNLGRQELFVLTLGARRIVLATCTSLGYKAASCKLLFRLSWCELVWPGPA